MKTGVREELGYHSETMLPVFENLYVKQYVLYEDESVSYYFQESDGKDVKTSEKKVLKAQCRTKDGKYGKINAIMKMTPAKQKRAMAAFKEEEKMADKLFKIY